MLERLKDTVCEANKELVRRGLVFETWGNASAIDREQGLVVIKPSGVSYDTMTPGDMVVIDLEGAVVEGALKPSVDAATHRVLYKAFPGVGGIVHTHSHFATCFAQARRSIPCFGTTHADYFHGEVPLAPALTGGQVADEYERNIGEVIAGHFRAKGLDYASYPAVLAAGHAPFAWGPTLEKAVESAAVLEEVARMALHTLSINPQAQPLEPYLLDKHFLRKHGAGAYYGQACANPAG